MVLLSVCLFIVYIIFAIKPSKLQRQCKKDEVMKISQLCDNNESVDHLCSMFCSKDLYNIEHCYRHHKQKQLVVRTNISSYGRVIIKNLEIPDNFSKDPIQFNERVTNLLKNNFSMEHWTKKEPLETEIHRRSFWAGINSMEYVLPEKYKDEKLFAPVLSRCSTFLVSERLQVLNFPQRKYFHRQKLELALRIISLVEKLDKLGLSYCDFYLNNLAWDPKDKVLKIIDLDNIRFKSKIEGQKCKWSKDCFQLLGCKSLCTKAKVCSLRSSNIQYACNKIFLNGVKIMSVPGLLNTERTSSEMMEVLDTCSQFGFKNVTFVKEALNMEMEYLIAKSMKAKSTKRLINKQE